MSDDEPLTCPRCNPSDRVPEGGSGGYIWWEDATEDEQESRPEGPDGDGETPCFLCDGYGYLQDDDIPKAQAWLDGKAPLPPAVPARFSIEWLNDDTAHVHAAVIEGESGRYTIGLISFNGRRWDFVKWTRDGSELSDGSVHIDCGPEEQEFATQEVQILTENGPSQQARLAALKTSRELWRDETRSTAALGGKIAARHWWREFAPATD